MTIAHFNDNYEEKVTVSDIPMQAASLDIWDKKYRLKSKIGECIDASIEDTYKRVALALSRGGWITIPGWASGSSIMRFTGLSR